MSYARSKSEKLGIDPTFLEKHDVHIHIPAGATPKDGPSAGVTLVTALISALTNTPICNDIAMTGEISLRGRVLPVGGIKEKILAAVSAGMKRVLIPSRNEKDLADIPSDLRGRIKVQLIDQIDEVWPLACGVKTEAQKAEDEKAKKAAEKRAAEKKAEEKADKK